MVQLVTVGACYLDTILTVPHYPREDSKLRASRITRRRGGNSANTLEVLQQLLAIDNCSGNVSASLCAVMPDAASADMAFITSSFVPPLNIRGIHRTGHSNAMSSYIIQSEAASTRTIVSYSELDEMTTAEFVQQVQALSDEPTWFHFEGRIPDITLECMHHLRQFHSNAKISVEIEKPGRGGLGDLIPLADVIFFSGSWSQHLGFTERTAKGFLDLQASVALPSAMLCCTWGSAGATLRTAAGEYLQVDAFTTPGTRVVDTVGAGDVFNAGMLWTLLCRQNWSDARRLAFANELAGTKVVQDGFAGLARLVETAMS